MRKENGLGKQLQVFATDISAGGFFSGSIDEVRFFNNGLSSDQVFKIYKKDISSSVSSDPEPLVPAKYQLYQNYPNSFNPVTNIRFELPQTSNVTLKVYDITGRIVSTMVNEVRQAGSHQIIFNGGNLASGIYIYELKTTHYSIIRKLTLIK